LGRPLLLLPLLHILLLSVKITAKLWQYVVYFPIIKCGLSLCIVCIFIVAYDAVYMVDTILPQIVQMLGSCKVSVYGRDNMMELLIKFVTRKDGVGWSKKFIDAQGFLFVLYFAHRDINLLQIIDVQVVFFSHSF